MISRSAAVVLSSLILFQSLYAAQSVDGIAIAETLLADQWQAGWIAPPDRDLTSFGVFHFRKVITLEGKPDKFIIHVSADN
ncbi:MAG TPA: hypothetical protein VJ417_07615, partial [Candidatus Glassbacteria bacterium]|nr:hypothetical protein [Candidatus Glassbacteria bacterium]